MDQLNARKAVLLFHGAQHVKQREFEQSIRAQLHQAGLDTLQDVKRRCCVFDLSRTYWFDLGSLLWLISLLHMLRKQENEIQLLFPDPDESNTAANLWSFLIRWRFFEALIRCVDDPVNLLKAEQIAHMHRRSKYQIATGKDEYGEDTILHTLKILEITTIRAETQQQSAETGLGIFLERFHDELIRKALNRLCGWDEGVTRAFIQRVIREGIRNVLLHAEGSFATVAMRLDKKNLTLAIADNGIGIPQTLRRAFKESGIRKELVERSDLDLIKFFTEPEMILDSRYIRLSVERGVSSRPDHTGEGLFYLKSLVFGQGGELRIRSGKACIDFTLEKEKPYDDMLQSPGTVIRIQTPLKI